MKTITLLIIPLLSWPNGLSWAKTSPQTELNVTLLGQPCLLQGPLDIPTLKSIHSIGPAQLYPTFSFESITAASAQSKALANRSLEKLLAARNLPPVLDRYKERLKKRIETQILFFEAYENYNKTHSQEEFQTLAKKVLKKNDLASFEKVLKKLTLHFKNPPLLRETIEQLFDTYNEGIEPDPEEDFHRAIKRLNIHYICTFEDNSDEEE